MKSSRNLSWSELKLGAILIAALMLLAVGILWIGGNSGFFTRDYTLYLHLDNTFGLKEGSTVRLAGLTIGNVEEISFTSDPANPEMVIKLRINSKYEDRIREDSLVSIKSLGLLGDKYLDISVGSPKAKVLEDGDTFSNMPQPELANVLAGASSGIEGLNAVIEQLRVVMTHVTEGHGSLGQLVVNPELYNNLNRAIRDIEAVAEEMHGEKGTFGKLIKEPELYDNLLEVSTKAREVADNLNRGSLARLSGDPEFYKNLREISDNLNDVSGSAKDLVRNLQTGTLAKISSDEKLHANIKSLSDKLDNVMAKLENGQGSAGKLINDPELYNNMNKFFLDADELARDIKENPDRYVNISLF